MHNKSTPVIVSVGEALINARRLISSHPREAAAQAREIIGRQPDIAEAYVLLSCALRLSGMLSEAAAAEQQAIACALNDPVILRAKEQIAAAEFASAEKLLNYYLADTPNDPVAVHLRAQIQVAIGSPREAERLLRRSLALAPGYEATQRDLEKLRDLPAEASSDNRTLAHQSARQHQIDSEPWFTSPPDAADSANPTTTSERPSSESADDV